MKQLLKVAQLGHPVLRQQAQDIQPERITQPDFQDFVDSMIMTMHEYDGVGLAAPQVHASVRLVVFHEDAGLSYDDGSPLVALINPEISHLTQDTSSMWEGCLSVPGLRGRVSRPNHVRVTALDRNGRELDFELDDFAAVVVQHECDHLDGVLFIDRLDDTRKLAFEQEFARYVAEEAAEGEDLVDA